MITDFLFYGFLVWFCVSILWFADTFRLKRNRFFSQRYSWLFNWPLHILGIIAGIASGLFFGIIDGVRDVVRQNRKK